MQLLTFAHRGEARSFFDRLDLTPVHGNTLYRFKEGLLLITGEGLFESMNAVTKTITEFPSINEIINLGVAGALDSELTQNEIVQVRTAYLELEGKPQFHSFSTENIDTPFKTVDCLTSTRRILDQSTANELLPYAAIVDRELWAIARAVKEEKTPLISLKVISDLPSEEKAEICQVVKDEADHYSNLLFDAWKSIIDRDEVSNDEDEELPFAEQFHFTTSMRTSLTKKLSQLHIKYPGEPLEDLINFESIIEKEIRPKDKANELIHEINGLLNPYRVALEKRLSRLTPGLKSAGLSPSFDPNLEKVQLHIKGTMTSKKDIDKAISQLEKFDFDQLKTILEGEMDV
jgi:hypothetical protein